jgi:hypothetical protein
VYFTPFAHLGLIQLRDAIALKLKDGPQDIDILHWTSRVALELIGQSGLGICQNIFFVQFADAFQLRSQLGQPW